MPTTIVDIYNRALSNLGTRSAVTGVGDGRKESIALNKVYEDTRDDLLKMHDWAFARRTALLVAQAVAVAPTNWANVYARPADCLNVLYVLVPGTPPDRYDGMPIIQFETSADLDTTLPTPLEVDVIYCDESPCSIRYTYQVTNTARFTSGFKNALCWALAANVAEALGLGTTKAQAAGKAFTSAFNTATAINANERTSRQNDQLPPWLTARN